jgi:ABC-2 type transport system permease protein
MSGGVSRIGLLLAILRKDFALQIRDWLFIFITILSVVTFVTLYWVLPRGVDETISMGVRGATVQTALAALADESEEGLGIAVYETTDALKAAVEDREVEVGIDFPNDFVTRVRAGSDVRVTVFARPSLPQEMRSAMTSMVREMAYAIAGHPLPVTEPREETVILGEDRAGQQMSIRDRLRPLYAFIVLIMEAVALGTLIASEVQHRTITAVLATPAGLGEILAAKGIVGTVVAFTEASLVTLLIQGFGPAPGIVLVAILLGAILVTGIAMIAGSAGKDMMGTLYFSIIFLIPLIIPGFAVLFPGSTAGWVKVLPSYGLVQTILVSSYQGGGWAESAGHLGTLAAWCVVSAGAGLLVLKRRVETL